VCGTEVKAITYSAMQIREADGDAEVFVIVDI
jgi:SHS2 domain-containing protein